MRKVLPLVISVILFCFVSCASFGSTSAENEVIDMHDVKVWVSMASDDELGLEGYIISEIQSKSLASDSFQNYNLNNQISDISSGSAFAISDDLLMTSNHVIENYKEVDVMIGNTFVKASVLYAEKENDIAILRVPQNLPYHFKISSCYKKGDAIMAIGYPLSDVLGNENVKFTDGIISSETGFNNNPFYLQITAPIQPGNSGGPVVNNDFEVVGIVQSKLNEMYLFESAGTFPQNINFALKPEIIGLAVATFSEDSNSDVVTNSTEAEDATFFVEAHGREYRTNYKYNFKLEVAYNEVWRPDVGFTIYSSTYKITNIETGIVVSEGNDAFNNGYIIYSFNNFASSIVQSILKDMYDCEFYFKEHSEGL